MIRISKGEIHHVIDKDTREFTVHHYVEFYRQPIRLYTAYKVYHFWDMHFMWWHKVCEAIDETYDNWSHRKTGREKCKHIGQAWAINKDRERVELPPFCSRLPYMARQDMRCHDLWRRKRIELGRVYLDEVPKSEMTGRTVLGPPNRESEGVSDVDSMDE